MKLQSLNIELQKWGKDEGKYIGTIQFEDENKTEVKVTLTAEQADRYLAFSTPILMAAADNAAEQFKTKLVASFSYANQQPQLS